MATITRAVAKAGIRARLGNSAEAEKVSYYQRSSRLLSKLMKDECRSLQMQCET